MESEHTQSFPVSFEPVDRYSGGMIKTYIGNTGGEYTWIPGADCFTQEFAPDAQINPATDAQEQRKYATLYPAVLYEFIQWQDDLPDDDERKSITTVSGSTEVVMSSLRAKLLGDAYTFEVKDNPENPAVPIYNYEIDLAKVRNNETLMNRLETFNKKAKRSNYQTRIAVPESGEIKRITIRS